MEIKHLSMADYLRKEADVAFRRFVMFGFVLIMFHIFNITPKKYDGFGVTVNIPDQTTLFGLIAIVVLYEFYQSMLSSKVAGNIEFIDPKYYSFYTAQEKIKETYPHYSANQVWITLTLKNVCLSIFYLPFLFGLTAFIISAFFIAVWDVYLFLIVLGEKISHTSLVQKLFL